MNTAQLPSRLTPSVKPQRKPNKLKRIAAVQEGAKERIRAIELEIFHVWDALLLKTITADDADHKVWLLRDDIRHIKETMTLDIKRIREE